MKVAVYCGSRSGNDPLYADKARELGDYLGRNGIELVFGGGHVGLMGVVADAVLAAGGRVHGVIPEHLRDRELAHSGLTELHVVKNMHERKALMADLADGFVALPGGGRAVRGLDLGPAGPASQALCHLQRQRVFRSTVGDGANHGAGRVSQAAVHRHADPDGPT